MSAIVLSCFAIAMSLFQISCQKEVTAQGSNTSITQINKIIYAKSIFLNNVYTGVVEIWVCNSDGTGNAKVNITLPAGVSYSDAMTPAMSPNGQKIFFTAGTSGTYKGDLYSCNPDGSNLTKIVDREGNSFRMGGAY